MSHLFPCDLPDFLSACSIYRDQACDKAAYLIGGALAFTMKDIRQLEQKSLTGSPLVSVYEDKAHRERLLTILLQISENVKFFGLVIAHKSGEDLSF